MGCASGKSHKPKKLEAQLKELPYESSLPPSLNMEAIDNTLYKFSALIDGLGDTSNLPNHTQR